MSLGSATHTIVMFSWIIEEAFVLVSNYFICVAILQHIVSSLVISLCHSSVQWLLSVVTHCLLFTEEKLEL